MVKIPCFERNGTIFTAGVMSGGNCSFSEEEEMHITLTVGECEVRPPGSTWKRIAAGDTVVIPAKSRFDLKVTKPASYICMYK